MATLPDHLPAPVQPACVPQACGGALCWQLRRNCRLTPAQLGASFAAVCVFQALLALAFWAAGFPLVGLFAGLEVLALGVALLVHARHACDRETITLAADCLCVEQHCGTRVCRVELPAAWVRVQPDGDSPAALLRLSAGSVSVCVGRHLCPAQRPLMARELRRALALAHRPPGGTPAP
ncbi:DUF2244 domain-containing protein [Azohydromonas caseinilytica]|uniref:DUF2244 domain-containing protein n=1 Tax=Azohydromonas caseinilytica TaxID=2728836 RepID=A0A848FHH6_9BURK|nr:DUF2244 domain-containing protein [Azohydromonas caseinilytica]NML17650.1 DUF2244 domain-containing protein [Azohydromonas caseinilytica]